jgi:hypothetical protein
MERVMARYSAVLALNAPVVSESPAPAYGDDERRRRPSHGDPVEFITKQVDFDLLKASSLQHQSDCVSPEQFG